MKASQKGFSLIELMIVIAIIGILAAIAIPSYQTYVKKSKISRVIQALSSYENEIAAHYTETGQMPIDLSNFAGAVPAYAGGPLFATGDVVQVIWYPMESPVTSSLKGFLGARLTNELGGGMISLVPLGYADGSITFSCGFWNTGSIYAADSLQYMPVTCNNADQENL